MRLPRQPDPARAPLDGRLIDAGWATATGPRPDNQDRAAVSPTWAIVSDGAGGHRGGALAAELTVDAAVARFTAAWDSVAGATGDIVGAAAADPSLVGDSGGVRDSVIDPGVVGDAVADADAAVRARQAADPDVASMAATLTLAVAARIRPDGSTWIVANVGDSPAWRLAGGRLTRVSEEDNLAAELVRAGAITRDEARRHPGRHVITQAVGAAQTVAASPATVTLRPGDRLVLASDGIEVLDDASMMEVMSGAPSATQAARRLVDAALARGATDNVTVAVIRHRREPADLDPAAGGPVDGGHAR